MEQFLGLSRDASREKAEPGTSPYNRNIVYNKKLGSITQEDGFEYVHEVPGVVIGTTSTNTHIVYISYDAISNQTLISYVDTATNVLTTVINTAYFGYEPTRPIEIIGWYNYNQELLIMFSDGVFEKSTAPRLINLMDIDVVLDVNKEFANQRDADSTLLFSTILQPLFSIKYGSKGTHDADLLFFTIAYILPDGTTSTRFLPILAEAFPLYAFKSEYKKEVTFKIENLDTFFTQFIIGIIAYRDNGIFGYTTDPINITSSSYEYAFNSVIELNSVAVDSIIIESSIFDKVKSLTIGNDAVILGGVTTKKSNSYQKYANNIRLNLHFDYRLDNRHQAPLLCPDEVYYFTIAAAFNNGSFSEEFHIPNFDPIPSDLALFDKNAFGLNDLPSDPIANFQVINKGDWANPSVGLPDFNSLPATKLNWGYWQNQELYPNNDNYNGALDYDGITVIPGGRDLRNTNVKLHRVPGLDALCKKFPMRLGMDIRNEEAGMPLDLHTRMPAFSITVENFMDAFASVITTDNIVGYRLSFVKKDSSSKLVEDINFIKPLVINTQVNVADEENVNIEYTINKVYGSMYSSTKPYKYYQYGFSRVKSINLSVYKGTISPKIIKANYGFLNNDENQDNATAAEENSFNTNYRTLENDTITKGTVGQYCKPTIPPVIPAEFLTFRIPLFSQTYAVVQSIEQTAGNVKASKNLFIHEQVKLKVKNSNTIFPVEVVPTPAFGWNPLMYSVANLDDSIATLDLDFYDPSVSNYVSKTLSATQVTRTNISSTLLNLRYNIHQGLQPKSFVVIGSTNIENPTRVFKDFGDTFSNNIFNEIVEYITTDGLNTYMNYFQQIYSGLLAIDNNTLIEFVKDKLLGYDYATAGDNLSKLVSFNYNKQITNKQSTRQLNTLIANIAFNYQKKYINSFPFRIVKSLPIQSEDLSTGNVRTFLANAYYDMPSIRGEVIYVVGFDRGVYCQQRYSLCIFQLKEKLSNNDENTAYLAETDLFAYKPQPIIDEENKGYIGCVHQFGKRLSKVGLLTADAERGKFYIIAGNQPKEISKIKMENDFKANLEAILQYIVPNLFNSNAVQDNPYNGNGILIGIDDKNNRILLSINNYKVKQSAIDAGAEIIDGIPYHTTYPEHPLVLADIKHIDISDSNSKTLSFNLDWQRWVAEHDYYPQYYNNTNKVNYAGINIIDFDNPSPVSTADTYITNKENTKTGKYFYNTDPIIYESFTDLLFNSRYDLSKWYKSVLWRSTVVDNNGKNIYEKTINAILLYTDYQCSGRIELDTEQFSLVRNSEGIWNFNDFRDMVKNSNSLPIVENGTFDVNKVHLTRSWFEKSDFISNFIVIRLIMDNINNTRTHIHNVNVEARISERI